MKINIKVLNGRDARLTVTDKTTVSELKELVEQYLDVPRGQQRIVFKGKTLQDAYTLKMSGIEAESKILVTVLKDTDKPTISMKGTKKEESVSKSVDNTLCSSTFSQELQKLIGRHFTQDAAIKVFEQFMKNWPQHVRRYALKETSGV